MQENTSLPQEAKPTSKIWKLLKLVGIGIVSLFTIIVIAAAVDSSNDTKPAAEQSDPAVQAEHNQEAKIGPLNIEVTSQIVKKVDGKYRYFFDIRNKDTKDFEGSVTIQLVTAEGRKISKETFNTNKAITPGLGTSQYIDTNTGPVSIHGESGYAKFTYEVKVGAEVVKTGEGNLTEKYEDLSE